MDSGKCYARCHMSKEDLNSSEDVLKLNPTPCSHLEAIVHTKKVQGNNQTPGEIKELSLKPRQQSYSCVPLHQMRNMK